MAPCYSPARVAASARPSKVDVMMWWLLVSLVVLLGPRAVSAQVVLEDLDGQKVRPVQIAADVAATVAIFASTECPVSNRYAPTVERLRQQFSPKGVRFYLVYPNPAESAAAIKQHMADYGYKVRALVDPTHAFVKAAEIAVTPEAVVFDARGKLVYRGRIDDRFVSLGVERPAPTKHDLADAIASTLAGKAVSEPRTQAVGCFVSDFLR